MPSQVISGHLLNEMLAVYPNETNAVLSSPSPFNRITAVRNHNTAPLGDELSRLKNTPAVYTKTDASPIAQMGFESMTLSDLLSINANYEFPPTSNEFRVILFNDALKSGLFQFKAGVVQDAKNALLSGSSPSYKHLSSLAVSLAQSEKAFNELKQKGLISEAVFRHVSNELKNHAIKLSDIGNAYHSELIKRPGEDIHHAYLVVESHKRGNFTKLCKQTADFDKGIKSLLNNYPDVKSLVSKQMNDVVCQFINHYFQPEASDKPENWREFSQYIKENAMDKITALFKNDARNRPGHLFDAGGAEHLYDCYSEIFDHFKTRQEAEETRHAPPPAAKAAQPDDSVYGKPVNPKGNTGSGINNNFSPIFNPINSPNFYNNINDSLLDKLDSNNRLLAEILEKLTPKQWSTQGTQTDSIAYDNKGTDPMPASLSQSVATQTSVSEPTVPNPESIQTQSDRQSLDVVDSGPQTVLPTPASWTKLVDSIRHITVTSTDTHPTIKPQMTKPYVPAASIREPSLAPLTSTAKTASVDEINVKSIPPKHHVNQNELQNVKLRPTKTRDPMTFGVNRGYRERDYYENNGTVSPGFVSDRRAAYEDTLLAPEVNIAPSNQAPVSTKSLVAERVGAQKENRLALKSTEAGAKENIMTRPTSRVSIASNEIENVRLKPTRTRDPMTFGVNRGYHERDYYEDNGAVSPGFVSDRRAAYEDTLLAPEVNIAPSNQAPVSTKSLVADRVGLQEENRLAPKSIETGAKENVMTRPTSRVSIASNELEKVRLKPTRTRDPMTFAVNQGYQDRDYYDEQGNVKPGFVSDRQVGFESDTDVSSKDETVFHDATQHVIPAKPILTATRVQQQLHATGSLSPEVATLTLVPETRESDLIFHDTLELKHIAAREIKRAEKVKNNHDFLAQLKSEKKIKVM